MAHRRPKPLGFEEKILQLKELEDRQRDLQVKIDEVVLWLTVENPGPTETIAEELRVTTQTVAARRRAALKRREQRNRAPQDKQAA